MRSLLRDEFQFVILVVLFLVTLTAYSWGKSQSTFLENLIFSLSGGIAVKVQNHTKEKRS